MSLTPDEWRELDEAERAYAEANAAVESNPDLWRPLEAAALKLNILAKRHLRALIDAARPKCERCSGSGSAFLPDADGRVKLTKSPCPRLQRHGPGMSELTPEQWQTLDHLQRRFPDLDETWAAVVSVRAGRSVGESAYLQMLVGRARTLIDAARPKCERCSGEGVVVLSPDPCPDRGSIEECPDCKGTGWAE